MITLAASDPSIGTLAFRLLGSLAVVVGLLLLIARFVNRRFSAPAGAPVQVMHRQSIGRGQGVAVISVGGRVLVVGTTEHQVTLLTELDPDLPDDAEELAALDSLDSLDSVGSYDSFEDIGGIDPIVAETLGLDRAGGTGGPSGFGEELADAAASYDATPGRPLRAVTPARPARPTRPAQSAQPIRPNQPVKGALSGSVLSPQTWKQTFAALKGQPTEPPGRRAS